MQNAKDVVVETPNGRETAAPASPTHSQEETPTSGKKTKAVQKATPLPMRQLVPMTFVLLNESLCGTMLTPFIGYLVTYLQNRSTDDAGYFAGILIGVFSFGQVLSARFWGRISDKYGRRFPLISGLFTAGFMMLGFGLSGSIWSCAFFRFLQGVSNGNVLVAKTMMADITDRTNQSQGFAFVSFVSAIGMLFGPLAGGLLYDPTADDSALRFLALDPNGLFGRRPALLPALMIFLYSMVGMAVCTMFVQESNPNAQPLPRILKLIYPCLLVPAKPFQATPMADFEEVTDYDDDSNDDKATGEMKGKKLGPGSGSRCSAADNEERELSSGSADSSLIDPRAEVSVTFPVGVLGPGSPIALEDTRRFDRLSEERWLRSRFSGSFSHSSSANSFAASASTRPTHSASFSSMPNRTHCHRGCKRRKDGADKEELDGSTSSRRTVGLQESASVPGFTHQAFAPENPIRNLGVAVNRGPAKAIRAEAEACECDGAAEKNDTERNAVGPTEEAAAEAAPREEGQADVKGQGHPQTVTFLDDGDHDDNEDEASEEQKSFGYAEAFRHPITRIMLVTYMILCGTDMTVKQCFPLWAISSVEKGGLGFSTSLVSYVLLFNSVPTLASNYLFSIACSRYANKIGLFRVGVVAGAIFGACISMNSYFPNVTLQFCLIVLCSSGQQFFATWCYGLITMLTARAAPPGQVGTIMGINQSCGATARAVVPIVTSALYAWSISGNHPFPFNHVLVFYLASLSFVYCWYRSYSIKTTNDTDLELVTTDERYGPPWLRAIVSKVRKAFGCKDRPADRESNEVVIEN